ncbi:hypothetical protein BMS3Bbin04_01946 [bacterium BMS3Bbin04]|nr:hypothetical protein BMS3Bbin04_01946 [bacterium BMS3Bbin04]
MKCYKSIFVVMVLAFLLSMPAAFADTVTIAGVQTEVQPGYVTPSISHDIGAPVSNELDEVLIDFDDFDAPSLFDDAFPLTNEYEDQGIVFDGLGEVLNEDSNFGVTGHSYPNFLAFNVGAGVPGPETMIFDPYATELSLLAGCSNAGTITLDAYNSNNVLVDTDTIVGAAALATLSVTAGEIAYAVISFSDDWLVVDDVLFDAGPGAPVTLTLTPTTDVVPATGGDVVYDASVVSTIGLALQGLGYETYVTLPNQQVFGPLMSLNWNLVPFMNVTVVGMSQYIPDYAPVGNYYFEGRAGFLNIPAYTLTDGFPFTKSPPVGAGWYEDFEDGLAQDMDWFVGDMGSYMIDGGYAKVDVVAETDDWGSGVYTGGTFGDCTVFSTHELIQTGGYSVGMLWRGDGVQGTTYNGYAVYCSNGSYSAWVYTAGAPTNLVGWTDSGGIINQGVGAINDLELVATGSDFDFYANGSYLGSWSDGTYATGYAGVVCAYTNETWFDEAGCSTGPAPDMIGEIGQLETVLRDHMGNVITNPADFYVPGVAFDRSEEILANIEFIPEDWVASGSFITGDDASVVSLPTQFEMQTAYPNPFNPTTSVAIVLPSASDLTVTVFNVMGQQVATLANGKYNAGQHSFVFDAANLSSGLYFIQAQVPGELNAIQKVTLMK